MLQCDVRVMKYTFLFFVVARIVECLLHLWLILLWLKFMQRLSPLTALGRFQLHSCCVWSNQCWSVNSWWLKNAQAPPETIGGISKEKPAVMCISVFPTLYSLLCWSDDWIDLTLTYKKCSSENILCRSRHTNQIKSSGHLQRHSVSANTFSLHCRNGYKMS